MAWFRMTLNEEEQRIVREERESHPQLRIRQRMLVLWLLHSGLTREKAAEVLGWGRSTVERVVASYRDGGLEGVRRWNVHGPASELASYRDLIRESLANEPVRTVGEACERLEKLTGLRRSPTQVRKFLRGLGLKWQRVRAIPIPPKKVWRSTSRSNASFCSGN